MKTFSLFLISCCLLLVTCDSSDETPMGSQPTPPTNKVKRVLVIGIDGVRPDALKEANTPNLDALISNGTVTYNAYVGGDLGTSTEQITSSGPGWSSILTGVWRDKHNVRNNSFSFPNYDNFPHMFTRIKEARPQAYLSSIVNWTPINDQIVRDADYVERGDDVGVALKAIIHLGAQDPDVLFLHFDQVDAAGHGNGFSPDVQPYLAAIEAVDEHVGDVMQAIGNRADFAREDWLTIVTTDHGGRNTSHGGQSGQEREIFMIVSGESAARGVVTATPGMVAVPPTTLKHLGIPIDPAWGWESEGFGLAAQ